jgi:hypothetical protein
MSQGATRPRATIPYHVLHNAAAMTRILAVTHSMLGHKWMGFVHAQAGRLRRRRDYMFFGQGSPARGEMVDAGVSRVAG